MKLLGLDIRRGRAPLALEPPGGVAGTDADSYLTAALKEVAIGGPDTNPLLRGRAKYDLYNEMRLSDAACRSLLWMYKLPIRRARWNIEPASDDPADQVVADACAWQLGLGDQPDGPLGSWDETLAQALLMLDWGSMFEELIWSDDVVDWRDADGDVHLVRPVTRLGPRFPATIRQWATDPKTGRLAAIRQDVANAQPIPGSKLSAHVLEREGGNWAGISMLRACYGPWRLKKALMVSAGISYDRHASGTPVIRYPKDDRAAEARAKQMGREYRQHERAYLTLPGAPPGPGNPEGWSVELLNGAATIADPVPLLQWYNGEIAASGLQQWSQLGTTSTGSRAVGDVLVDPFYQAAEAVADQVRLERVRGVLRPFVDYNFGAQVDLPTIRVSRIQPRNLAQLAAAMADLATANLSFTDRDVQNDVRDELGFAHLPEDVGVEVVPTVPPAPREGDSIIAA